MFVFTQLTYILVTVFALGKILTESPTNRFTVAIGFEDTIFALLFRHFVQRTDVFKVVVLPCVAAKIIFIILLRVT